jgi:hypothetical protein
MYHAIFKTVVKNIVSKIARYIEKNTRRLHFSKRLCLKKNPIPVLSGEAFKAIKNSTKIPCKIARYVYNGFWQLLVNIA